MISSSSSTSSSVRLSRTVLSKGKVSCGCLEYGDSVNDDAVVPVADGFNCCQDKRLDNDFSQHERTNNDA